MTDVMDPVMRVTRTIVDGKATYGLHLSQANLAHLSAGCPDVDCVIGKSPCGADFRLFPDIQGSMPSSFRPSPGGEGYFAYVGVAVPFLPPKATSADYDRVSREVDKSLEDAINNVGRIPIEEDLPFGKICLGYVVMRVESCSQSTSLRAGH